MTTNIINHNDRVDVPGLGLCMTPMSDQRFAKELIVSAPLDLRLMLMSISECERTPDLDLELIQNKLATFSVAASVVYTADVAALGYRVHFKWTKTKDGWTILDTRYRGPIVQSKAG